MSHSKFLSKHVRPFVVVLAGVSLVFLLGCPPLNFKTVPPVVGLQQSAAQAAILNAGLTVGTVVQQSYGANIGEVFKQSPAAGSTVVPLSSVDLWVSTGFDI